MKKEIEKLKGQVNVVVEQALALERDHKHDKASLSSLKLQRDNLLTKMRAAERERDELRKLLGAANREIEALRGKSQDEREELLDILEAAGVTGNEPYTDGLRRLLKDRDDFFKEAGELRSQRDVAEQELTKVYFFYWFSNDESDATGKRRVGRWETVVSKSYDDAHKDFLGSEWGRSLLSGVDDMWCLEATRKLRVDLAPWRPKPPVATPVFFVKPAAERIHQPLPATTPRDVDSVVTQAANTFVEPAAPEPAPKLELHWNEGLAFPRNLRLPVLTGPQPAEPTKVNVARRLVSAFGQDAERWVLWHPHAPVNGKGLVQRWLLLPENPEGGLFEFLKKIPQ